MKTRAVLEVVAVLGLTLLLMALLIASPLGAWERRVAKLGFLEYAVMIAVPLLLLMVGKRNLAGYGVSFKNLKYHLDIAMTAFVPVAIASVPLAFFNYKRWDGALVMAGVQIALRADG